MPAPLRLALTLAAIVVGFFLPPLLGGGSAIYSAFVLIAIFAVMSYGLDVIVSDLGEVSLAHTVFFAAGAYATALLSTGPEVGPLVALVGSWIAALVIALLMGLATLRLREFVFSLVTYAVAVVAMTVAQNWWFLGGSDGLRGIPIFSVAFGPMQFKAGNDEALWPVAFIMLLAALWLVRAFRRSRLGLSAMMVHLNPRLAIMSGVDPQKIRLQVFLFSAPITATGGWLYAYQRAYVSADVLEPYFLILMLTAVVIIGRRLLLGPLIGVALILAQEKFFALGGYVDKIILGSALVLTLAFLPNGLASLVPAAATLFKRRKPAAP